MGTIKFRRKHYIFFVVVLYHRIVTTTTTATITTTPTITTTTTTTTTTTAWKVGEKWSDLYHVHTGVLVASISGDVPVTSLWRHVSGVLVVGGDERLDQ